MRESRNAICAEGIEMTDLTAEVTVTIHETEIDLIAAGTEICQAEPDVGILSPYIDGWELQFLDGTPIPEGLLKLMTPEEYSQVESALAEALARGEFEPDQDRDERLHPGSGLDFSEFKDKSGPP